MATTKTYRNKNVERIRAYMRQYRLVKRESILANKRRYYQENKKEIRAQALKWNNEHPKRQKLIDKAGYEATLCEVCQRPSQYKSLHFDHNHITGDFRGWLCLKCNTALGLVQDDITILAKMIQYLNGNKSYLIENITSLSESEI